MYPCVLVGKCGGIVAMLSLLRQEIDQGRWSNIAKGESVYMHEVEDNVLSKSCRLILFSS